MHRKQKPIMSSRHVIGSFSSIYNFFFLQASIPFRFAFYNLAAERAKSTEGAVAYTF